MLLQNLHLLNACDTTSVLHLINPVNTLPAMFEQAAESQTVISAAAVCNACSLLALVTPQTRESPVLSDMHSTGSSASHWTCCVRTTGVRSQCSDMHNLTLTCPCSAALHTALESKPSQKSHSIWQCQAMLMSGCHAGRWVQHGVQASAGEVQA